MKTVFINGNQVNAFVDEGGAYSAGGVIDTTNFTNGTVTIDGDLELNESTWNKITARVKKSMGYDRVLEKCEYCGAWGAVMCSCPQCGAPIDPK